MRVAELLDRVTRIKHRIRVYSLLADTLQPYLDRDIGSPKVLESDGCLVRFVPKEVVEEILHEEIHSIIEECESELGKLGAIELEERKKDVEPKRIKSRSKPRKAESVPDDVVAAVRVPATRRRRNA